MFALKKTVAPSQEVCYFAKCRENHGFSLTVKDDVMIIDGKNKIQRSILTNKCFYQTTSQIMHDFESKGYQNSADETAKVIGAYHDIVKKRTKNHFNSDYNAAFQKIDKAIDNLANKVFYDQNQKKHDAAYHSFEAFDYVNAILNRQQNKHKSEE